MDWQHIFGSAGQQNALFWGGAAAVALGFALLAYTVAARLRQRLRRPARRATVDPRLVAAAYGAAPAAGPPATPDRASDEAVLMASVARALADAGAPPAPSLALLLHRLQLAGDRLEEVTQSLATADAEREDPDLKEDAMEVEYVFKACGP